MSETGESNVFSSFMAGGTKFAGKVGAKVAKSEVAKAAREGAVKGATDGAQKGLTDHFSSKYGMSLGGNDSKPQETKSLGAIEHTIQAEIEEEKEKEAEVIEPKSSSKLPNINIPKPHFQRKHGKIKSHPQIEQHRKRMKEKQTARAERTETKSISKEWDREVWCVSNFNFRGQLPCDLEFKQGDKIKVLLRTDSEFDWWEGEAYGKIGIFPANFVTVLNSK